MKVNRNLIGKKFKDLDGATFKLLRITIEGSYIFEHLEKEHDWRADDDGSVGFLDFPSSFKLIEDEKAE